MNKKRYLSIIIIVFLFFIFFLNFETKAHSENENTLIASYRTDLVAHLTLEFDARRSTLMSDGEIVSYEWDFGDETTGTGQKVEHKYSSAGTYNVSLTVTDEFGNKDTEIRDYTVYEDLKKDENNNSESSDTPGFEIIILFCAITILLYLKRKKF